MQPRLIVDTLKNHHVNRKDFIVINYQKADPSLGRDADKITSWTFTHDFTRHYKKGVNTFVVAEELYNRIMALEIEF